MGAGRVAGGAYIAAAEWFDRACYRAGMLLITLSGDRAARAWSDQVSRAERAERDHRKAMDALHDERRRGNHLFVACTLGANLIADGKVERAAEQLRLAVIAGRRKP